MIVSFPGVFLANPALLSGPAKAQLKKKTGQAGCGAVEKRWIQTCLVLRS